MNLPFRLTLSEKQHRPAGSAREGEPGTEHENKGESSKLGRLGTLSDYDLCPGHNWIHRQ